MYGQHPIHEHAGQRRIARITRARADLSPTRVEYVILVSPATTPRALLRGDDEARVLAPREPTSEPSAPPSSRDLGNTDALPPLRYDYEMPHRQTILAA